MRDTFNPLNAELNPICHLLALLGGATIVVVSRLRVKPKGSSVNAFALAAKGKELYRRATSKICQCYIRIWKAIKNSCRFEFIGLAQADCQIEES